MAEKTLVILKPDCVKRGLMGEVIRRYENMWLQLVSCKMENLSEAILKDHYSHIADKPFFPKVAEYMQSGPVMIQIWEWENAVAAVRKNNWPTNPAEAPAGTIRWDFALSIDHNIVHASEDTDAASDEITRFFS